MITNSIFSSRQWSRVFTLLLIVFILLCFVSCNQINENSKKLKKAEHYMSFQPRKAMSMIDSIPDSVFAPNAYLKGHNNQCLLTARYYKAASAIEAGRYEDAKHWLQMIVISNEKEENRQEALYYYDNLVRVCPASNDINLYCLHNQIRDSLVKSLLNSRGAISHFPAGNIMTVEKILLGSAVYWPFVLILLTVITSLFFLQNKKQKDYAIQNYQKTINFLSKQSKRQSEKTSEQFGYGKQLYEQVVNGGRLKNISIAQEQNFIDYYALAFPSEYSFLTSPYTNLSLRHTTYLILKNMGYTDSDIQNILYVKASTIRNYRLRINKNKRKEL